MTSANDNATNHIVELDGTRIAAPVAGKRINAFKKRYEDNSGLDCVHGSDNMERTDEGGEDGRSEDDE